MRTLLLTVLVSLNLVACVAGDNDGQDQGIEGMTETQVDMQTEGTAQREVKQAQQNVNVDLSTTPIRQNPLKEAASQEMIDGEMAKANMQLELQTRPVDHKNKYQEASGKETLDGEMAKASLEQDKLGRDVDAEQEELYNPNHIEQVDMVELLRGIHVSR